MWRREFFNFVRVFLLFCYYVPFERGVTLHLNKLKYPLPKDVLCLNCGSGEEDENVKSLQTDRETDRQTDDMRSEKLTMERLRILLSFIIGFY